jgi:hypothetical protein
VSFLAEVIRLLEARRTHAVIGAGVLAVHRVSRATRDLDFFLVDPACLDLASLA